MGKWHASSYEKPFDEPVPEPIAERLHREQHTEAPSTMVLAADSPNGLPLRIRDLKTVGVEAGHPTVNFDFGVVRSGLIRVDIESESGGTVDIGWDDRIENGRVAVARSTPNADRVELPPGRHEWISLFERGLRYLQLTFRGFRGDIIVNDVAIVETLTSIRVSEPAVFESSNELLNRIWRAASETVRLYMNGCAAGDPVRERAHWLGDDGLAMRAAYVLFGEEATWRRALELTAESQNPDGSLPVVSPGHFEDENMVSGSCSWAVSIAEYVRTTGDTAFGRRMMPHIRRHIDYERRFADANGLLYETPGRRFLSWADGDPRPPYASGETWRKRTRTSWGDFFDPPTRGWNAIINAYWLWYLRECAGLARVLELEDAAREWSLTYDHARAAFDTKFFVPDTKLWRDNVAFDAAGRENEPTYCESTLFTMMRAGLLDREHGLEAIDRLTDPEFVCCRTSGGLEGGAYPKFLMDAGRTDVALAYWLDRWGAPITAGATTCGEEFFQSSGNSDCHIHGAGPACDFIEYLAGIRIRGARWSDVLLVPPIDGARLPDLRATVPTPHGTIEVAIETAADGVRQYRWVLPDGVSAMLRRHGEEIAIEAAGSVPLLQPQ
jgi:alpha-L-rhamnosidase